MAARLRKRPLIDTVRDARFRVETEQGWFKVHVKICSQCARAGEHLDRRCDLGWQSAKTEHRAQLALHRAETARDAQDRQGTLW